MSSRLDRRETFILFVNIELPGDACEPIQDVVVGTRTALFSAFIVDSCNQSLNSVVRLNA